MSIIHNLDGENLTDVALCQKYRIGTGEVKIELLKHDRVIG